MHTVLGFATVLIAFMLWKRGIKHLALLRIDGCIR